MTTLQPGTLIRALTWPVVSLLLTGGLHFTIEAIWPDLQTRFVPSVLAPLLLSYGAWLGYRATRASGSFVAAIIAGATLGLLPVGLEIVGFGMMLNHGVSDGILAGVFGWSFIVFGSLLGAGFALSGEKS